MLKFDVFIVDAWATDHPDSTPVKFLVTRTADKNATTNSVSRMFERQGWTVTGCSHVTRADVMYRMAGAPNAGRWFGEHKAATRKTLGIRP